MSNKNEINFPINPNTQKLLNDSFFCIPATEEERNTKENEAIIALLDNYTRLKRKNYLKKFLTNLILDKQMNINFDDITYNEITKMYEVHLKNGNIITFDILSNQAVDKEIIKELNSIKRIGKCHTRSIQLSNDIKDSSVLTGYYITTKNKIFHSVV